METVGKSAEHTRTATGTTPRQKALGVPSLAPKEVSDDKAGPTQAQAGSPLAEMPSQGKEALQEGAPEPRAQIVETPP
jgi:hypothetical protein